MHFAIQRSNLGALYYVFPAHHALAVGVGHLNMVV
jgi:hypothetical protein